MHEGYEEEVEWQEWSAKVDRARPAIYKTEELTDWADSLITEGIELAESSRRSHDDAMRAYVLGKLRRVEKAAVSRANDLLRTIARDGSMPIDWMDFATLPIVIDGERIQLGHCAATDFRRWELHERRRAATDFNARNAACDGARLVFDWMQSAGVDRLLDLGGQP